MALNLSEKQNKSSDKQGRENEFWLQIPISGIRGQAGWLTAAASGCAENAEHILMADNWSDNSSPQLLLMESWYIAGWRAPAAAHCCWKPHPVSPSVRAESLNGEFCSLAGCNLDLTDLPPFSFWFFSLFLVERINAATLFAWVSRVFVVVFSFYSPRIGYTRKEAPAPRWLTVIQMQRQPASAAEVTSENCRVFNLFHHLLFCVWGFFFPPPSPLHCDINVNVFMMLPRAAAKTDKLQITQS